MRAGLYSQCVLVSETFILRSVSIYNIIKSISYWQAACALTLAASSQASLWASRPFLPPSLSPASSSRPQPL